MIVDKRYCMSSVLMLRTIADHNHTFKEGIDPELFEIDYDRIPIKSSEELEEALRVQTEEATKDGKAALALSGGIDSAILAKFVPKGTVAYTFKCVVPGTPVTDETGPAAKYAEECGLEHRVVEVYWEDYEKYVPILMKHKGAPMHSIEPQIFKAALTAKNDGFERMIYGETADTNYGGFSGLLSRDWTFGEFVDRYSHVLPYHVLKDPEMILEPYRQYEKDGYVDVHEFNRNVFYTESMGSYTNACDTAGIELVTPYATTIMDVPLDMDRVRRGENKYMIREIFERLYPDYEVPEKIPMPRPVNEWFKDWKGPTREEFWPNCTENMKGDQKWLVWCLEQFLNMIED